MINNILDRYQRRFESQKPRETMQVEVGSNPVVDEIFRRYEQLSTDSKTDLEKYWKQFAYFRVSDLELTAQDVREVSLRLSQYENSRNYGQSGFFLSALINACPETDFEIVTEHLEKEIVCFGYKNRKNVLVRGDLGAAVGYRNSGEINVEGRIHSVSFSLFSRGRIYQKGKLIKRDLLKEIFEIIEHRNIDGI